MKGFIVFIVNLISILALLLGMVFLLSAVGAGHDTDQRTASATTAIALFAFSCSLLAVVGLDALENIRANSKETADHLAQLRQRSVRKPPDR